MLSPGRRGELGELLRTLTARIRFLTAGGAPPAEDVQAIPADSGTLGPVVPADGLTVTVGVGASLFDSRYGIAAGKPARLVPMPVFPDDQITASSPMHGDLSLQICADSRDTVMHALRDIAKHTRGGMQAQVEDRRVPRPAPARGHAAQSARVQGRHREPGRGGPGRRRRPAVDARRPRRRARLDRGRFLPGRQDHQDAGGILGPGVAAGTAADDRPVPRLGRAARRKQGIGYP